MTDLNPVKLFRIEERRRRFKSTPFFLKAGLLIVLFLVPFIFHSFKTVDLAAKIMIFATLVASFDILLGYTGILSFGHGMFFGFGAYAVAFVLGKYGSPTYTNLVLGIVIGSAASSVLALLVSFLSLRVRTIFFAMITLAIAELAIVLATKLSGLTGGEDGISLRMPGLFASSSNLGGFMGLEITGRVVTYYAVFLTCLGLFMVMLRFIHSPLGRVLQSIRDNAQRAEALGYRVFVYESISITFGCVIAAITGGLYAMWVGYVNPESSLGVMTIMLDVLLMVIIGGMGTLYGGIIGAAFLKITQTFLPDLQSFAKGHFPGAELLHNVLERWLLLFGVLFILVVIFFPKGVLGSVRDYVTRRRGRADPGWSIKTVKMGGQR